MFTYEPKKFTGKHANDIIALLIHANRTVANNLVRVLDNVKNEEHITTISGDVPWRPYQEEITEAQLAVMAADSTLKFSDATVMPRKIMALDKFLMDQLRNTRFSADMKAGAANITSNEFQQTVITYLTPRLGKSFEKLFYLSITSGMKTIIADLATVPAAFKAWAAAQPNGLVNGIVAQMIASGAVNYVAGTAVTVSNIVAEYTKIFNSMPTEVAGLSETRIFAPESDYALILQANQAAQFRDIFTAEGKGVENATVTFLGVQIEFVPTPGIRFAGRAGSDGDFVLATDLLSDVNNFEISKVNNIGDAMFGKVVAALDAACLLPQQKVLYVGA